MTKVDWTLPVCYLFLKTKQKKNRTSFYILLTIRKLQGFCQSFTLMNERKNNRKGGKKGIKIIHGKGG